MKNRPQTTVRIDRRRRWLRGLLAVGFPAILFLCLEAGLRLAGYGYPTTFFLSREVNGQLAWINNWQFGWRFFPREMSRTPYPVVMPQPKPPGTTRIFIFGESAALGVPAPECGFGRMLKALLANRFPGRKFEVINCSVVAINSHAILPIARECARRDGDLWVIYMGNNEVIGPFGAYGVLGARTPPLPLIHASLAFKATRFGQLFDSALQKFRRGNGATSEWHGMQMWKDEIRRDDPRIGRVQSHFRKNLEAILDLGRAAGVPVLLSTVACNLKDCSPFASRHRADLTPGLERDWDQAYQAGATREADGHWEEALGQYERALRLDDQFAELHFRMGTCWFALGRTNEARQHFRQAKDQDALQFRPDTRLNEAIRQVAAARAGQQVRLLDAEEMFAQQAAGGVPGEAFFYEHVHLTPAGNYLLALRTAELAAAMVAGVDAGKPPSDSTPWLSELECEQRVGLSDWRRYQALQTIQELVSEPPFTGQSIHSNQVEHARLELKRLRPSTRSATMRVATQKVEHEFNRDPTDANLLTILAPMLEAAGETAKAEQRWRELTGLLPHAAIPCLNLGQLLGREGRNVDAMSAYEECLRRNPDVVEAHGDLGLLLLQHGQTAEAISHLRIVVRRQPESVAGHWRLAQALLQSNQSGEAGGQLQQVLRLDPNHAEAKRILGSLSKQE